MSITEELIYAQDLRRGVLLNRRCAADLRLFLELGRKPPFFAWDEWEDTVSQCLQWESVPGSGAMDIEPVAEEEGNMPAYIFVGIVIAIVLTFANVIAPELIGRSLFGPPDYIFDPSEMQPTYGVF
jgi:hypothetical protein